MAKVPDFGTFADAATRIQNGGGVRVKLLTLLFH
jgi:hypothetical protein